jgi:hypothetical protein
MAGYFRAAAASIAWTRRRQWEMLQGCKRFVKPEELHIAIAGVHCKRILSAALVHRSSRSSSVSIVTQTPSHACQTSLSDRLLSVWPVLNSSSIKNRQACATSWAPLTRPSRLRRLQVTKARLCLNGQPECQPVGTCHYRMERRAHQELLRPLAFNHIRGDGCGFSNAFSMRSRRMTLIREIA